MKKRNVSPLILLFGICAIVSGVLLLIFFYIFIPLTSTKQEVFVTIPKNVSASRAGYLLKEQGVIRSERAFVWYARLTGSTGRIRAGSFSLSPSYSVANILGHLTQANGAAIYTKVTFPEGFDLRQMDQVLREAGILKRGEFYFYAKLHAKKDFQEIFPFLQSIPGTSIEGYLFPSTYYFTPAETPATIIKMMLIAFQKQILPLWESAPAPFLDAYTFHEILTMSSIIQKEAQDISEMPTIGSVYYNRLNKNMRLEADPTVVYGLGLSQKDRVLYADTKKYNPFNTYRIFGLPPGPIASPGVDAFKAALNPAQTPYLFFVANGDGTHHFTRTYKEHLQVQRVQNAKN